MAGTDYQNRVDCIVDKVLKIPQTDRVLVIQQLCGQDSRLRHDVEKRCYRLSAVENGQPIPVQPLAIPDGMSSAHAPDDVNGSYRLVKPIDGNSGGMGEVWLAKNCIDDSSAAIKFIRPLLLGNEEAIKRFGDECYALQQSDDCINIVRLYEKGETTKGEYFFAMEYVSGPCITQYCNEKALTVKQRVELFIQACRAIGFVHAKSIVHRDIKPENVLVRINSKNVPEVKVIDFGIAKFLESSEHNSNITRACDPLGTYKYMSPEQKKSPQNVDERSDIFQLGLLFFQMIVGQLPSAFERWQEGSPGDVDKNFDVTPISVRRSLKQIIRRGEVAKSSYNSQSLQRDLSKGLDWIVAKTLRRMPGDRYQTVTHLIEDLDLYLTGRAPKHARPDPFLLQARDLYLQNKATLNTILVLVFGVAMSAVIFSIRERHLRLSAEDARNNAIAAENREVTQHQLADANAREARRQQHVAEAARRDSETITDFLVNDILAKGSPDNTHDWVVTNQIINTLFKPAAAVIEAKFKDNPPVCEAINHKFAQTLNEAGRSDLAFTFAEQACDAAKSAYSPRSKPILEDQRLLADIRVRLGQADQVVLQCEQDYDYGRKQWKKDDPLTRRLVGTYIFALQRSGQLQKAVDISLDEWHRISNDHNQPADAVDTALDSYTQALIANGQYKLAAQLLQKLYKNYRVALRDGQDDQKSLVCLSNYGNAVLQSQGASVAQSILEDAIARQTRLLGYDHPNTLLTRCNYAQCLAKLHPTGDWSVARAQFESLINDAIRVRGPDHPETLLEMTIYAETLCHHGDFVTAEPLLKTVVDQYTVRRGPLDSQTRHVMLRYAQTEYDLRKYSTAYRLFCDLEKANDAVNEHDSDLNFLVASGKFKASFSRHSPDNVELK